MDFDYKKLGFKAGIEIHQELNTNKLFCNCSSELKEEKLVSSTIRKLRAVVGETGVTDIASLYEQLRDRSFEYHGYENESCLVDLDEEPPHPVNKEAFTVALGVSKMFRLKVPDTVCVMRKTVVDGSAITGFQRTMLIGMETKESYIETSKGNIKINQLNLEEDSCRIKDRKDNKIIYSLSRLGIPLLEIGTGATLINPAHVKETALLIGTMVRAFNVKRGIGTIRQDINVSIKGGARVEVKGWQDLRKLEQLVYNEVVRQYSLLEVKRKLKNRGLKKFKKISRDVTDLFLKTKSKLISTLVKEHAEVHVLVLPKFGGLLKQEIMPGKSLGKELSDYAVAYGTKGIIHSDEDLNKYDLSNEFQKLKNSLKTKDEDLVLIIAEKKQIVEKAIESIYSRAVYCLKGVPEETRIPNHESATSAYARPLPGAHRLYPETDIPHIKITAELLKSVKIPETLTEKIHRYSKKYSVSSSLAKELIKNDEFETYVKTYKNLSPAFIAHTLVETPKEIKKRYNLQTNLDNIDEILKHVNAKKISQDAVFELLVDAANNKKLDFEKYNLLSEQELENIIIKIISETPNLTINALIGKVMNHLRGKAPGSKIVEIVKKHVNK